MTRLELLKILIGQARSNGFEFRRWFTNRLELPWTTADDALSALDSHRRYYSLLFSHDFARAFWKAGAPITVQLPPRTFLRVQRDGSILEVQRKAHMRRSTRNDVWRWHLREMALAPEPLRYIRRFLHIEDELDGKSGPARTVAEIQAKTRTLALARKAHARRLEELALDREMAEAAAKLAAAADPPKPAPRNSRARLPKAPKL